LRWVDHLAIPITQHFLNAYENLSIFEFCTADFNDFWPDFPQNRVARQSLVFHQPRHHQPSSMAPRRRTRRTQDDEPQWTWADDIEDPKNPRPKQRIKHTAARCGRTTYKVGDIVQICGETTYKWVGLILGFEMNYSNSEDPDRRIAEVMWFCRQQDILKSKTRKGAHEVLHLRVGLT